MQGLNLAALNGTQFPTSTDLCKYSYKQNPQVRESCCCGSASFFGSAEAGNSWAGQKEHASFASFVGFACSWRLILNISSACWYSDIAVQKCCLLQTVNRSKRLDLYLSLLLGLELHMLHMLVCGFCMLLLSMVKRIQKVHQNL